MAYNKTTWANGDVITAEKLNKMEDGIANAGGGSGLTYVGQYEFYDNTNDIIEAGSTKTINPRKIWDIQADQKIDELPEYDIAIVSSAGDYNLPMIQWDWGNGYPFIKIMNTGSSDTAVGRCSILVNLYKNGQSTADDGDTGSDLQ